jgi:hypothetical protein
MRVRIRNAGTQCLYLKEETCAYLSNERVAGNDHGQTNGHQLDPYYSTGTVLLFHTQPD